MRLHRDRVYVAVLAALAAYFMIWPIWRVRFPVEIWFIEAWNSYYQAAAAPMSAPTIRNWRAARAGAAGH